LGKFNHKFLAQNTTTYHFLQLKEFQTQKESQRNETTSKKISEPDTNNTENKNKNNFGMFASVIAAGSLLFGKTKYILGALKLTKAVPLVSMVVSSASYSLFFGWPYAIGMVGQILLHECGHAIVMRHYGVPFSPMVFVPFMGAVISRKKDPESAFEDAMIAFGGPVLGSAFAGTISMVAMTTDSQLLYALADWGYMVNLFNLLPIGSLDGGKIGDAISPYIGVGGLLAGGSLIYNGYVQNPIFYLIMLGGTYSTVARLFGRNGHSHSKNYYSIGLKKQTSLAAGYVGLVLGLVYLMEENNKYRKTPKRLEYEQENPWYADLNEETGKHADGTYDSIFSDSQDKNH